jgi:hypothetical protein
VEVPDITLGSLRFLENIIGWEVSSEPSLSDHRHFMFILRGSIPVRIIRDPRGTNWCSLEEDMRDRLERDPVMDHTSKVMLDWGLRFSAYEANGPLRPVKMGRQSLKWTNELESLRK